MTITVEPTEGLDTETDAEPCIACDGNGAVCGACLRPRDQCECEMGCSGELVDCGECGGTGEKAKPAATEPEGNPEDLNGTPKDAPKVSPAPAAANDAWRTTCIDALQAHGISEKLVESLRGKSIETLGDLADFQAKHGEFWAKEIKGLGPQKAAKVADAQAEFWKANPQFCESPAA